MFRSLAVALSLIWVVLPGCDGGARDEVRAVFEAYNQALRDHNGDAFLKVIDPENTKHYGQLLGVARSGDRLSIERLTWVDKDLVTLMRNRFTAEELKRMDGAEFVRTVVGRGWFFKEEDGERFTLGMITIKPPRASAPLLVDGDRTDDRFEFVEVEHQWLVNDECMDKWFNKELERLARVSGISEDTFILAAESEASGKRVGREIWEAPPK